MSEVSVGVVGAGVMGAGIAQATATVGMETTCYDIVPEALERARREVTAGRFGFDRAVERGKLDRAEADAALGRLRFTTSLEEIACADLVVECVPEKIDVKIRTFREVDRLAPAKTVLASNTSGFPIAALAAATNRPERVVGWHWASPPVVMKMAEIVVTEETSDATVAVVRDAALRCGKNPVVVRDSPTNWGFVANRIYFAMIREAQRVVDEGVTDAEGVNQLMVDCFRWPVGPFAMVRGATKGWK